MRFLWAWLLLILAVPLAVLAVTAPIEMGGETHTNLFLALGAACFVLGFGIAAIFGIRNDRLRKKSEVVSEKIQQRDDLISALWMASIIDLMRPFMVAGLKSRRNAAWARMKQLLESQGAA